MVNIGAYGTDTDCGVFMNSPMFSALEGGQMSLPQARVLPDTDVRLPYVFVGDEAFPLKKYLMRPFPKWQLTPEKVIFNQRLSGASRVVECSFGILSAKWRIFNKCIETKAENAIKIVQCTTLLHNIIIDKEGVDSLVNQIVPHSSQILTLPVSNRFNSTEAREIRQTFCIFFNRPVELVLENQTLK